MDLLHVDFDHRNLDLEFNLRSCDRDLFKDMADHARNHTSLSLICDIWTKHRMRLTTTCLSISKDCAIETLHDAHDNRLHSLLINETLWCIRIEDLIIIELLRAKGTCAVSSIDFNSVLTLEVDELLLVSKDK